MGIQKRVMKKVWICFKFYHKDSAQENEWKKMMPKKYPGRGEDPFSPSFPP